MTQDLKDHFVVDPSFLVDSYWPPLIVFLRNEITISMFQFSNFLYRLAYIWFYQSKKFVLFYSKSTNEFRVILGQENFLTKNKEDLMFIETHEIKTISIHPRYKPEDLYIDDIAILEVKTPIISSNVRQTICLPNQTTKSYSGKTGVVLGNLWKLSIRFSQSIWIDF